jgi:hypothetical protein
VKQGIRIAATALWYFVLASVAIGQASESPAPTAHDYFNELKAANTFNHYKDEYVCFRDDDVHTFEIIAKVSDVIDMMKKNGETGTKVMLPAKDSLFVKTYYKGVGSEDYLYEPVKKDVADEVNKDYTVEFGKPMPGKMVYSINWETGRYLLRVFMFRKSRTIPTAERAGKCELIHPAQ